MGICEPPLWLANLHSLNTENRTVSTNWVFRAQPIPYDWVPEGTPRSEKGVAPIDIKNYRVQ